MCSIHIVWDILNSLDLIQSRSQDTNVLCASTMSFYVRNLSNHSIESPQTLRQTCVCHNRKPTLKSSTTPFKFWSSGQLCLSGIETGTIYIHTRMQHLTKGNVLMNWIWCYYFPLMHPHFSKWQTPVSCILTVNYCQRAMLKDVSS